MKKPEPTGMRRREFLKAGLTTTIAVSASATSRLVGRGEARAAASRREVFSCLGDTLIPSSETNPGFRSLEPRGITQELMNRLSSVPEQDVQLFNDAAETLAGRTFVATTPEERAAYLRAIAGGSEKLGSVATVKRLQSLYRLARMSAMTLFYDNFPEHRVTRDARANPVPRTGDTHFDFNPNTAEIKTGWDVCRFGGPLSWEQEEERRKKYGALWKQYEAELHVGRKLAAHD